MPASPAPAAWRDSARIIWRRALFSLRFLVPIGLLVGVGWKSGMMSGLVHVVITGLAAMLVFSFFERWPKRLPAWLARWVLQVVAVGVTMPFATFAIFVLATQEGAPLYWRDPDRMHDYSTLTGLSLLLAPWAALAALVWQKDSLARHQALAFQLERSELERKALDARLHLLQAQVAPHFLFNTLANVQALVDAGSPRASDVLRSLTAYLRAAVPLLHEPAATLAQELQLVRAYLELMHMRMPDRLQFKLHVDDAALALRCPPITLLTLVENAVRHGIDPSEEGGRIGIRVVRQGDRCVMRVSDSGVGLRQAGPGMGAGLSLLRERLQVVFDGDAQLRVTAREPQGVCAELEIPAREVAS